MEDRLVVIFCLYLILSIKFPRSLNFSLIVANILLTAGKRQMHPKRDKKLLSSFYRHKITPSPVCVTIFGSLGLYIEMKGRLSFHEQMHFQWARLGTFERAPTSLQGLVSAIHLARDGFFYIGPGHACKCAFCGFVYSDWCDRDIPKDVHSRLKPHCIFICSGDAVNFPINATGQGHSPSFSTGNVGQSAVSSRDGYVSSHQPSDHNAIENQFVVSNFCEKLMKLLEEYREKLNEPNRNSSMDDYVRIDYIQRQTIYIQIYRPEHPDMILIENRLRTFRNFPNHISRMSISLAEAGFYYTGNSDTVRCHYCDGGIKGWNAGDSPWKEHARYFPRCKYLRKKKGDDFVEKIQDEFQRIARRRI